MKNKESCEEEFRIRNAASCETASISLGYKFAVSASDTRPPGCYLASYTRQVNASRMNLLGDAINQTAKLVPIPTPFSNRVDTKTDKEQPDHMVFFNRNLNSNATDSTLSEICYKGRL